MSTLRDLVRDRRLYSVEAARSVLEAARYMMEHNIGAVPVMSTEVSSESFPSATS